MANSCEIADLIQNATCYSNCMNERMLDMVIIYLLCQWANQ